MDRCARLCSHNEEKKEICDQKKHECRISNTLRLYGRSMVRKEEAILILGPSRIACYKPHFNSKTITATQAQTLHSLWITESAAWTSGNKIRIPSNNVINMKGKVSFRSCQFCLSRI